MRRHPTIATLRADGSPPISGIEATISGRAIHAEVVHTHLNEEATRLVVEWWTPMHGLRRIERE